MRQKGIYNSLLQNVKSKIKADGFVVIVSDNYKTRLKDDLEKSGLKIKIEELKPKLLLGTSMPNKRYSSTAYKLIEI